MPAGESSTQAPNRTTSSRELKRLERATRASGAQHGPVLLLVVEDAAGAADDARERVLVDVDRQSRLLAEQEVEAANQRPAAGHHDAAIDDVAGQLGRRDLEGAADGVDDLLDRLLDRLADLARVDAHRLGDARDEVASLHFHLALVADGRR